jgi:hypothetical protein
MQPVGWDERVRVLQRNADLKGFGPVLGAAVFVTNGRLVSWPSYFHWEVMVPCWLMFVASACLTTWAAWRPVREWHARRLRPGACRTCGYDMRATPERCPECGAVPAKSLVLQTAAAT